jgi:hypothetical protein
MLDLCALAINARIFSSSRADPDGIVYAGRVVEALATMFALTSVRSDGG